MWLISASAWAQGVTDLKYYTNPEELFKYHLKADCVNTPGEKCEVTEIGQYASLNVSIVSILFLRQVGFAQNPVNEWILIIIPYCMAYCYVIYRYVISEWRSIRPVEINQYEITMATHYNITMGNDIARDVHCEITMSNDVARDIHCDFIISNDIAMCIYHDITMHNDVAMNIFYCVISALCLIVLFYYGLYGIKTRTSSFLISLAWRTHSLFLCRGISLTL